MGLARYRTGLVALTLSAATGVATAAEVRVLSVGSTQHAAKALAADFSKQSGHQVTFTITPPFNIDKELAAKNSFDAIIISVPAMETHGPHAGVRVALYHPRRRRRHNQGPPTFSTPEKSSRPPCWPHARSPTARPAPSPPRPSPSSASSTRSKASRHATLGVGGKLVADERGGYGCST